MRRRLQPAPPGTPDAPLVVFDGECVLCSRFVRFVLRHDRRGRFRFTTAQGPLGQAVYRALGLDPVAFETSVLVADGRAWGRFAGAVETLVRLGGPWRCAAVLRIVPAPLGDALYNLVARSRYAVFGRRETCWLPTPDIADRVV